MAWPVVVRHMKCIFEAFNMECVHYTNVRINNATEVLETTGTHCFFSEVNLEEVQTRAQLKDVGLLIPPATYFPQNHTDSFSCIRKAIS